MEPWIWPLLLLALGMGLAVLEVFFPSAGILSLLSITSLITAVVLGFREGSGLGLTVLGLMFVGVPTVIVLAFRLWPHTAMGKAALLEAPKAGDVLPDDDQRRRLKTLIGRIGHAKCRMLPGGVVSVDGQTVDAVSEGMVIEAGQRVRIIKVQANRAVVRPIEHEQPTETAEDPLERPIDTIAADPFEEPFSESPDRSTGTGEL